MTKIIFISILFEILILFSISCDYHTTCQRNEVVKQVVKNYNANYLMYTDISTVVDKLPTIKDTAIILTKLPGLKSVWLDIKPDGNYDANIKKEMRMSIGENTPKYMDKLGLEYINIEPEKYIAKLEFRHQLCSNFNAEIIYSQNMFFIFKGHLTKDLLQNYHESNKYPWLYKIDEKWYIYCTLTDE